MATHEYIRVHGPLMVKNPFYELPELAAKRTANPDGVHERIDAATEVSAA